MLPHLLLASIAALSMVTLAISGAFAPPATPGSSAQLAQPAPKAETTTMSEMVPTQGWLWDLFGGRGAEPQPPGPRREPGLDEGDQFRSRPFSTSGTYRTVCVRLCDGFGFPISHATTRNRFARDADRCQQACPGGSRLFVHRASDDGPASMKDLKGHPYEDLENAFRHQREYVSDCTCRGNPWDENARARHRAYAQSESMEKSKAPTVAKKQREHRQASRREHDRDAAQRWARSNGDN
jgi:Protein of unknown function (DUF2865)